MNTLSTARQLTSGRVITVFGCGGDRDKTKRAPMGKVAGELSDIAIITSDNPRTEDPLKIIADIEAGIAGTKAERMSISDRREAIATAIKTARAGDVVIIAGKGHETYQIIGGDKFHFDREVALEAIAARRRLGLSFFGVEGDEIVDELEFGLRQPLLDRKTDLENVVHPPLTLLFRRERQIMNTVSLLTKSPPEERNIPAG